MEQNIIEICNIIISKENIRKPIIYCENSKDHHRELHKNMFKVCKNCGSIICDMCCNKEGNVCILCLKKNDTLAKYCKLCVNYKRYYMCGMCSNVIERCNIYCKNNNEIICDSDRKYLLCETCNQK